MPCCVTNSYQYYVSRDAGIFRRTFSVGHVDIHSEGRNRIRNCVKCELHNISCTTKYTDELLIDTRIHHTQCTHRTQVHAHKYPCTRNIRSFRSDKWKTRGSTSTLATESATASINHNYYQHTFYRSRVHAPWTCTYPVRVPL